MNSFFWVWDALNLHVGIPTGLSYKKEHSMNPESIVPHNKVGGADIRMH